MVDGIELEAEGSVGWTASEAVATWLGAQLFGVLWASGVVSLDPTRQVGQIGDSMVWFLLGTVGLWLAYLGSSTWLSVRRRGRLGALVGPLGSPVVVVVGLMVGVAAQLVVVPVVYGLLGDAIDGDPEASARALADLADSPIDVVGFAIAVVIVAPIAEEFIYRGVLLQGLVPSVGAAASVMVTSAVFALAHGELVLLPGLVAFALILGGLAHWFRGLTAPIAAHMAFNATTVVVLLVG